MLLSWNPCDGVIVLLNKWKAISRIDQIYIAGVGVAPPQLVTAKVRLRLQCDLTYLVTATLMQVLWIQRDPDMAWRLVEPIIHYVLKIRTFCVLQYWVFYSGTLRFHCWIPCANSWDTFLWDIMLRVSTWWGHDVL